MLHTLLLKCRQNSDEQKEAKEKQTNSPALSSMLPAWCDIDLTLKVRGVLAYLRAATYRVPCD